MSRNKCRLKIDFNDLELAFNNGADEIRNYLDLNTGKIDMVIAGFGVSDDIVLETDDTEEEEDRSHKVEIPRVTSDEGYTDMVDFIKTVSNHHLQGLLQVAIRGAGAFSRFRDVVYSDAKEHDRWEKFQYKRLYQRILDWLESENIDPIL